MSFLSRLFGRSEGKAITEPVGWNSTNIGWNQLLGGPVAKWQTSDSLFQDLSPAQMEDAYRRHPVIRACVREIQTSAAEPRLEVGMDVNGEWEPLKNHAALDLLNEPNEHYTRNDVIQYLTNRLTLTGRSYAWKLRNKSGSRITELWPLPTSWVNPVADRNGTALYRGYKVHGQRELVPVTDIFAAREIDPASTVGAVGGMHAAQRDYLLDNERMNYLAEMLVNLKVPGLAIQTEGPLSPSQRKELRDDINSRIGRGSRGEVLLLQGKGKIIETNPLMDLDWPGLTGLLESRICMAFGVPPIVIGARIGLDRSTYSNYEEARRSFYIETMAPLWATLADAMTLGLLRQEGESRLRFRFRFDELSEFQEDADKRAMRAVRLYRGGLAGREEGRAMADLDGDTPDDVFGAQPQTVDAPGNTSPQ